MNGAGGNSTRLMFDDDDDYGDGTALSSVLFALLALALGMLLFKVIYECLVTPLRLVPGPLLNSLTSVPMRWHMLRGTLPEYLQQLHDRFGSVVRLSPQRVSVADGDLIRQVLGSSAFLKTPSYDMPAGLRANTFSTRSVEESTARRRLLGPGFARRKLEAMEPALIDCGVHAVRRMLDKALVVEEKRRETVVQYQRLFSLVALDTIGALGFGCRLGAVDEGGHALVGVLRRVRLFNYASMALPWLKWFPGLLAPWRRRLPTVGVLEDFAQAAIVQRRQQQQAGKSVPDDLLQLLLDAGAGQDALGVGLSEPQLVSESILHLVAGVDTTAAGLTWTLALLLAHPTVMQRLVAEIRREFPAGPTAPSVIGYEACRRRLPYLAAAIQESLRTCPPAPGMLPRLAPAGGVRLGGYAIPAGTWICCSVGAAHADAAVFPAPLAFDPERFLATKGVAGTLAFSTGVRACLGRGLALAEMSVVLANLLRDYDLRPVRCAAPSAGSAGRPLPCTTRMTMDPLCPDRDCLVVVARSGQ